MSKTYLRVFGHILRPRLTGHAEINLANVKSLRKVEADLNKIRNEK